MAVQPIVIPKEREEKGPDPLDQLLRGLQLANGVFGIVANLGSIDAAKQQREMNSLEQQRLKREINLQGSGYKPTDTKDLTPATPETPGARKVQSLVGFDEKDQPKFEDKYYMSRKSADYTPKELDELISKGGMRYGKEGEKGVTRSVLLPDNSVQSVLLVDTGPEKAAALKAEKAAERAKDLQIAKLNNASKEAANELKKNSKDAIYAGLPKESQIQIDKIAGSMGDVTAVRNSLAGDLEQFKNAKTEAEKITIGQSMIKTLNSKMGKDAVGTEEAKRLAPYLEYQIGNLTGAGSFIGRDLPAFEKQVEASLAGLDKSISLGNQKISELKGVPVENTPQKTVSQTIAPTSEDRQALEWAKANVMSPDAAKAQKARAILSSPGVAALLPKRQDQNTGTGGGQSPLLMGIRGR